MKYESANNTIKMIVCHICINVLRIKLKINAITKITITKTTPNMPEDANLSIKFPNPAAIRGRRLNKATIVGRRLDENGHRKDNDKTTPITQCLEVRATNTDKSNCLTTVDKDNVLTPLPIGRYPDAFKNNLPFRYYTTKEMCRLQTVPDNFLNMIPDSAARKALGNGWTVDVIAHIFSFMK